MVSRFYNYYTVPRPLLSARMQSINCIGVIILHTLYATFAVVIRLCLCVFSTGKLPVQVFWIKKGLFTICASIILQFGQKFCCHCSVCIVFVVWLLLLLF